MIADAYTLIDERSTTPAASITTTAASLADSNYGNAVNQRQNSPPISVTEQPPITKPVHQQPLLRRQDPLKANEPLTALSSGVHITTHSTVQARQASAIDQHRFDTGNDAELSKSNVSHPDASRRDVGRPPITGFTSLPEQFFTQQNNFGTRQQRYNVRFAATYTSENMPPSQKSCSNDRSTPPTEPTILGDSEQHRSHPIPLAPSSGSAVPASDESAHHVPELPQPARESRDHGDREPSVERCVGCNEAWKRSIPDRTDEQIAPARNNEEYMRLAGNLIDRLRNERKKADAAYDDWKWRHSHCYRQPSPYSTDSSKDANKRTTIFDLYQAEKRKSKREIREYTATYGAELRQSNKRKPKIPHEPHSASKQQKRLSVSPSPPVRKTPSELSSPQSDFMRLQHPR
jgi:hypothetical protein